MCRQRCLVIRCALWAIIALIAVLSFVLYLSQGGFGGGHGKYDFALGVLSLPWCLISWPSFLYEHDFVWLILLPLLLNSLCLYALINFRKAKLLSFFSDVYEKNRATTIHRHLKKNIFVAVVLFTFSLFCILWVIDIIPGREERMNKAREAISALHLLASSQTAYHRRSSKATGNGQFADFEELVKIGAWWKRIFVSNVQSRCTGYHLWLVFPQNGVKDAYYAVAQPKKDETNVLPNIYIMNSLGTIWKIAASSDGELPVKMQYGELDQLVKSLPEKSLVRNDRDLDFK